MFAVYPGWLFLITDTLLCRAETDHLIELLRSRTADLPEEDGHARRSKLETSEVILGQKDLRKSTKEGFATPFDSTMIRKSSDELQFNVRRHSLYGALEYMLF